MRNIIIDDKIIYFDKKRVDVTWSTEAAEDLRAFPEIDLDHEVTIALILELDRLYTLTDEEKEEGYKVIKKHLITQGN